MIRMLTILALMLTASCGQTQIPIQDVRTAAPDSGPPDYYFFQTFPGIMEFEQGIARSVDFISHVRVPSGEPVLSIEPLPQGAVYDGKVLTWTPPCGDFPDFYKRNVGVHQMIATLRGSTDDEQFVQQKVAFIVHKFKEFPDRKCGGEK